MRYLILILFVVACGDDVPEGPKPTPPTAKQCAAACAPIPVKTYYPGGWTCVCGVGLEKR